MRRRVYGAGPWAVHRDVGFSMVEDRFMNRGDAEHFVARLREADYTVSDPIWIPMRRDKHRRWVVSTAVAPHGRCTRWRCVEPVPDEEKCR